MWVHHHIYKQGYDAAMVKFDEFKGQVAAEGKAAQERATAQTLADKQRKESADATHEKAVADLNARIAGLRNARAGSSFVPAAATCPGSPERAGFDRAELERTLREFDTGIQKLVDEGSRAIADLDSAKSWAQRK